MTSDDVPEVDRKKPSSQVFRPIKWTVSAKSYDKSKTMAFSQGWQINHGRTVSGITSFFKELALRVQMKRKRPFCQKNMSSKRSEKVTNCCWSVCSSEVTHKKAVSAKGSSSVNPIDVIQSINNSGQHFQ